jgi:hypothetical protein
VAGAVLIALLLYSRQATDRTRADTPDGAARQFLQAHNTAIASLGGLREWSLEGEPNLDEGVAAVWAGVIGGRDSGRFYADLEIDEGRWTVRRAALVLAEGGRLPLAGEGRPTLEPVR